MRPITGTSLEKRAGERDKTTSLLPRPLCPSNLGAPGAEAELSAERNCVPAPDYLEQGYKKFGLSWDLVWFWLRRDFPALFINSQL